MVSADKTSLSFSWDPPSAGAELTTGYTLTCIPLLRGILVPQPLDLNDNATFVVVTGLHPGVVYKCSIATVSSEGFSQSKYVTSVTLETGNYSYIAYSVHLEVMFMLMV